ncbi:hypothetical protein GPECTOR_53g110 [Gonium pectorale]|uniref:LysM domain-containing protein n=1 Tax=Gonium pectorale TaxID=33097 RepID=A0A150G6R2_GONPE|nr:hypothetical protein GPECTOR_53g110 [Gonium pectorale]|eukprot:KXZ45524.1 hypothetical protein GPECTOR_53g110 [Gonium pectorale]
MAVATALGLLLLLIAAPSPSSASSRGLSQCFGPICGFHPGFGGSVSEADVAAAARARSASLGGFGGSASDAEAAAAASARSASFGHGGGGGFSSSQADAHASSQASSFGGGGCFGCFGAGCPGCPGGGGVSFSSSQAEADAAARAASLTGRRLRGTTDPWDAKELTAAAQGDAGATKGLAGRVAVEFGLSPEGAACLAAAKASASAPPLFGPADEASHQLQVHGGAPPVTGPMVTGEGLHVLASCGARPPVAGPRGGLTCRRVAAGTDSALCDLAREHYTSCLGLRLVNPGVAHVAAGQHVNVPPCSVGSA